jgi:hypothetical protein
MKTVSGQLHMTKTERNNIQMLLAHCREDLSYEGGGTYNLHDNENTFDQKKANKAIEAIKDIEWIVSGAIIK